MGMYSIQKYIEYDEYINMGNLNSNSMLTISDWSLSQSDFLNLNLIGRMAFYYLYDLCTLLT